MSDNDVSRVGLSNRRGRSVRRARLLAVVTVGALPRLTTAANSAYWDTDPNAAQAPDGNRTRTANGSVFVTDPTAATTPYTPVLGDSLTFGNGSVATDPANYTVMIGNGGSVLDYTDTTNVGGSLTFNKNYTLAGTAPGDWLSIGTINLSQNVAVNISSRIGTEAAQGQNRAARSGATLSLSGGGIQQNLVSSGNGGTDNFASQTTYSRTSFGGGAENAATVVDQTAGSITGSVDVGNGIGSSSSAVPTATYNLLGGSLDRNTAGDLVVGEGANSTALTTINTGVVNVDGGTITDAGGKGLIVNGTADNPFVVSLAGQGGTGSPTTLSTVPIAIDSATDLNVFRIAIGAMTLTFTTTNVTTATGYAPALTEIDTGSSVELVAEAVPAPEPTGLPVVGAAAAPLTVARRRCSV